MAILNNQMGYPNLGNDLSRQVQYPYANNNLITNSPYDNYMGRNVTYQPSQIQYLRCRPVSSKEEARACQIELDGSLNVFTDVANGKIYTKQINNDGTATFKTYALTTDEDPNKTPQYVTKDEFNSVIQKLVAAMPQQKQQATVENKKQEGIYF